MRKPSSTNYQNEQGLHAYCAAAYTLSVISGRWKLSIISLLGKQNYRFSALKIALPLITERILALQLKELESKGIICRRQSEDKVSSLDYTLTPLGKSLTPLLAALAEWAKQTEIQ